MVKPIVQLLVAGVQAVGKAFMKAVRQEISASQAAAARAGGGQSGEQHAAASQKLGISLQEAKQILNVDKLSVDEIQERFDILYKMNEKSAGGSFYLQSKIKPVLPMLSGYLGLHGNVNHASSSRFYSTFHPTYDNVFSDQNKTQCIRILQSMSPPRKLNKKAVKFGSILVPLCIAEGKPSLLYTVRSKALRNHSGEVCFPGGIIDDTDDGPVGAALRETHEEIGIPLESISIWGTGAAVPSRLGDSSVTSVLGYIGDIDGKSFQINHKEVSKVFSVPLESLCDPQKYGKTTFRSSMFNGGYTLPVFFPCEPRIWGMTAIITHSVLKALLPSLYLHNLKHPRFLKI